jgi:hypothetical protein
MDFYFSVYPTIRSAPLSKITCEAQYIHSWFGFWQNFALSIVATEARPNTGDGSEQEKILSRVDLFLILAFLLELLLNAYANWFHDFVGNIWNW